MIRLFSILQIFHVSTTEIENLKIARNLEERFSRTATIPGTRKYHSYESISGDNTSLLAKTTSSSPKTKVVKVIF